MDEDRLARELRRLRHSVEQLLLLNGIAYGLAAAVMIINLATRIFR